jgi:hypothetical protein
MDVVYKQKKHEVVINLIDKINTTITKIKTLFIFSSFVTFIEALRLIIIEYVNKSEQSLINIHLLSTLINVLVLSFGIMITILSSYIRFKNYREILEELREKQNVMIEYIDKYKKQKDNLEYIYKIKEDNIKFEELEKIKDDIAEYDTKIESTNILEYLTTKDIIRFNKYKGDFDLQLKETILNYKKEFKTLETKYEEKKENSIIANTQRHDNKPYIIVQPCVPQMQLQPYQPSVPQMQLQLQHYQPCVPQMQPSVPLPPNKNQQYDMSKTTNTFYNLS